MLPDHLLGMKDLPDELLEVLLLDSPKKSVFGRGFGKPTFNNLSIHWQEHGHTKNSG